jgi:NADPH-dependent ferric siderophore reductase
LSSEAAEDRRAHRRPRGRPLDATVLGVEAPTPLLRRVRARCPGLADGREVLPGAWARLYVPAPEHGDRLAAGSRELPGRAPRSYTITRWDPAGETFALDLVLHGDGPAARWAEAVAVGETVPVAGPIGRFRLPPGPVRAVFAGDTTALPAIRELAAALAPGSQARVLVEAPVSERADLPGAEWVDPAQGLLARALAPDGLVPGEWVEESLGGDDGGAPLLVWIGAEAGVASDLRRHLVEHAGVPPAALHAAGYWRRGASGETP